MQSNITSLLPLGAALMAGGLSLAHAADVKPAAAPAAQNAKAENKSEGKERQLNAVNVSADADKPDGLRASKTRVGKTVQDPHDIPQAVTTVTNKLMEQQQTGSLREALRNVAGLSFNAAEGGRSGDNMNLRGFYTFGDMYLDGIRDTAQYNRETFNLEQIDVLRGAGAMLFGRGQAGGVINQVSKTPWAIDALKLSASIASRNSHEATLDWNKVVSPDTAFRVNLMKRKEVSARVNPSNDAHAQSDRDGAAFSMALNRTGKHKFWLNLYQVNTHDNPDFGISFDAATRAPNQKMPADWFWGTDKTFDNSDSIMSTLVHEVQLTPQIAWRNQVRRAQYHRTYWAKTPNLTNPPSPIGAVGGNQSRTSQYDTRNLQSDLSGKFKYAGMTHEWLAGLEYLKEGSYRKTLNNFGTAAAPVFRPWAENVSGNPTAFTGKSWAVYAQDTVEFVPQWKATLGLRRDSLKADYSSATSPKLDFAETSVRSALSFHPKEDSHYYLAYSDSFSPTADLYQLTVKPQPAERSNVIELGGKWLLADGDLALRAALYRATKNWERNADLESTAAILTKKRRTDGLEFEVAGRLNEHWEIFGGVSLMRARILQVAENINASTGAITYGNPEYVGKPARNTPSYSYNLWTTYDFRNGFTLGGGVEGKGKRAAVNPSGAGAVPTLNGAYHPNTAPAYTRVDLMASWQSGKWLTRLNIKNLANTLYYDAVYDNGGFTVPGPRRTVALNVEYTF
ncbi:TonB-dependent receptor [Massilia sp. W12]|uniref:TonB-dependent receptor n=1 Tax=Massilia sp. W12 TaxID=3126507 RepID=UPI0030D42196